MRAKILSAVYAAIGVQQFILPADPTFSSITQVAWIVTESVVIAGASILASDATRYLVDKTRTVLFDQPFSRRREGPASSAPPASSSAAAPARPVKKKESGPQGEVVSTLVSVAEAGN